MEIILQLLITLCFPFLATQIHKKVSWLSPIIASYAIGILIGNLWPEIIDEHWSMQITGIAVLFSIPMLVFGGDLSELKKQSGNMLKAFSIAVIATLVGTLSIFLIFSPLENIGSISAMITGVYTGGTANLNAIGFAIEAPEGLFIKLNAYDTIFSGIYLLFLFSSATKAISKWLGNNDYHEKTAFEITGKVSAKEIALTHLYTIAVIGITVGIVFLIFGELNSAALILILSILGFAVGFTKPVKKLTDPHTVADYWLQVFAIAMGSMAQWNKMNWEDLSLFQIVGCVFAIMLLTHYAMSKLLKVDAPTSLIASTAAVFGPPFIGPVAKTIKAEKLIVSGIAVGIIGNILGTYLGMVIFYLLR